MDPLRAAGQVLFDDIAADFLGRDDVTCGRMFGSDGLAVRGKFFAFVGNEGRLMAKIPQPQAEGLKAVGDAGPVTLGRRTMREWVSVAMPEEGEGSWRRLIGDAHDFVAAITPRSAR